MPDQNLVLRSLPQAVLERLRPRLRAHSFDAGHIFFTAGDRIGAIHFMQSGAVSLVSEMREGQMIESAMIGRDGVVGGMAALDDREVMHKAIVQLSATGFSLDMETARHMVRESEEFRTAIVRCEQLVLAQAQQSAACNAVHSLEQRLARWLLRARDVTGRNKFDLTQEFISEMLGVRRTSVSIVAHSLQKAGLISYRRGHITIDNVEALQSAACECYHTVKSRYDAIVGIGSDAPPATVR